MIEAWRNDNRWLPVRTRSWLERGWPELKQRFPTHELFSKASLEDILGDHAQEAKFVEASHFESAIFLNRGSHFECVPLPREAQLSPVFSINVGDVDGDGIEDLFLSQNFFGSASDISRDDAGRGLWLRGTGTGTFTALDSQPLALSCSANNAARPWRTLITTGASTWRCQKTMGQLGYTPTSVPNAGCGSHPRAPA